jgi:hypothetical protein
MSPSAHSTFPTPHPARPHDGSELVIQSIVKLGDDEEIIQDYLRQFLKSRNYTIDCYIPFWNPPWLNEFLPLDFLAHHTEDEDETNMAIKLCLFRSNAGYNNSWQQQTRLVYAKLYPYHLTIVRPQDSKDAKKNMVAESFPILQAQQEFIQE